MLTDGETDRRTGITNTLVALQNCLNSPKNIIVPNTTMRAATHFRYLVLDAFPQYFQFRTLDFQQRYKTIITQQHAL
jgi:hypothetical protein